MDRRQQNREVVGVRDMLVGSWRVWECGKNGGILFFFVISILHVSYAYYTSTLCLYREGCRGSNTTWVMPRHPLFLILICYLSYVLNYTFKYMHIFVQKKKSTYTYTYIHSYIHICLLVVYTYLHTHTSKTACTHTCIR